MKSHKNRRVYKNAVLLWF